MSAGLLTLREAAGLLGESQEALYQRAFRGTLPTVIVYCGKRPYRMVDRDVLAAQSRHGRFWSEADDDYLREHVGLASQTALARQLRRTPRAVETRCWILGLVAREHQGNYTACAAAAALSMNENAIRYLIRRGEIRTTTGHRPRCGSSRCYQISPDALEVFIKRRIARPPLYARWHWRQIPPGYLRNYAARLAAQREV